MHRHSGCAVAARQVFAIKRILHNVNNDYGALSGATNWRPSDEVFRSLPRLSSICRIHTCTKTHLNVETGAGSLVRRPQHTDGDWHGRNRRCNISIVSKSDVDGLHKASTERAWATTTAEVPVGGNGAVSLDIHVLKPLADELAESTDLIEDTLVYIPSGPFSPKHIGNGNGSQGNDEQDGWRALLDTLKDASYFTQARHSRRITTMININYRLSPGTSSDSSSMDRRFPLPIHDVAMAFEWILENLNPINCEGGQDLDPERESRTFVFGSHIGGSLALMLSLTRPNDFHAVVAHDPITEWIGFDELAASQLESQLLPITRKKRTKPESEETRIKTQNAANALIQLRTNLFRNPSGFFDPFASPLLFLRAPGRDTPLWRTAKPEPEYVQESLATVKEAMKKEGGIEVSEKNTREVINERGYGPYDDDWHAVESKDNAVGQEFNGSDGIFPNHKEANTPGLHQITTDLSGLALDEDKTQQTALQHDTDLSNPHRQTQVPFPSTMDSSQSYTKPQTVTDLSSRATTDTPTESSSSSPGSAIHAHLTPNTDSLSEPTKPPSRRRKVLRRWPPIGRPEDVDLPFIKIYSTPPPQLSPPEHSANPKHDATTTDESAMDLSYVLHPQAKEMVSVMRRACFWGREKSLGEERVVLEELASAQIPSSEGDVLGPRQTSVSGSEDAGFGAGNEGLRSSSASVAGRAVEWLQRIARIHK